MKNKAIFLSASIPGPNDGFTANPIEIREAIIALIKHSLAGYKVVFGGHPTISTLARYAANKLRCGDNIILYQSRYFQTEITDDAKSFINFRWTKEVPPLDSPKDSLTSMRKEMLASRDLEYIAAVFMGGKSGIEQEYSLFKQKHKKAKVLFLPRTGGNTKILYDEQKRLGLYTPFEQSMLETESHYPTLYRKMLNP